MVRIKLDVILTPFNAILLFKDLIDEKKLRRAFRAAKGSDGKVEVFNFKSILKTYGLDPDDKLVAEVLEELGDDALDDEALCLFFEKLESKFHKDMKLRRTFNLIDKDNDGYLDHYEIKQIFIKLHEYISDGNIEKIMFEADTDKDGRVNYNEFRHCDALKKVAAKLL
ncbi:hypothetical protein B4U79_00276 [Dinothrombium tinctorium]|uniref:EF-hand domain-containing protein n=1 Tax=Dinothrombium tinctorium TaxID=1965070 RepID=A0A443RHC6_9ACAR|nr:hypothetical protein B4U79_12444 [Dinothrombium tinctorium]RWS17292.1 hypothetical protein B4U79_02347 [Dinothrombium tinctorium]RWS17311.1 hypothetical protein B4U79_00276 [Dinothrombium tinctorium]